MKHPLRNLPPELAITYSLIITVTLTLAVLVGSHILKTHKPLAAAHSFYSDPQASSHSTSETYPVATSTQNHSFNPDPMDLDQGAYQLPEWLISNMRDPKSNKTLREMMPAFGYVFQNPDKPVGMPVGIVTTQTKQFLLGKVSYTSMNCNVCHAGQLVINDKPYTILGAPNKIDTTGWAFFVKDTIGEYLRDPRRIVRLYLKAKLQNQLPSEIQEIPLSDKEQITLNHIANTPEIPHQPEIRAVSHSNEPSPSQPSLHSALAQFNASLTEIDPSQILKNKAHFSKYLTQLIKHQEAGENQYLPGAVSNSPKLLSDDPDTKQAIETYNKHIPAFIALLIHYQKFQDTILPVVENNPKPGPGRDDAWSIIATYIGDVPLDELPPASVTKIPPLFPYAYYSQVKTPKGKSKPLYQFHADGNTTSFMERNLIQAMAIGSFRKNGTTLADLESIHRAELESRKLQIPTFQNLGLPHNKELAAKGKKLFYTKSHNYLGSRQSCASCHSQIEGEAFNLDDVATHPDRYLFFNSEKGIKNKLLKRIQTNIRKIKEKTITERPEHHINVADYEPKNASWSLGQGGYIARPLYGVWTSAPYLHNGSVRTIRELLTPPHLRETSFYSGTRNYDTHDLGYANEKHYSPAPGITKQAFTVIARSPSQKIPANAGHNYGTSWTDAEKDALIEYLKTMTPPTQPSQ